MMNQELRKLQGTWNIVDLEVDGHAIDAGVSSTIVLKGDDFTTTSMGAVYEGKFEFDPTKSPKTFDLIFTEGPEKGNRSLGIYELTGDTWKICLTVTGKKRPRRFATTPGSGLALETLKRVKGRKRVVAMKKVAEPSSELEFDESLQASGDLSGEWAMISCIFGGHPLEESLVRTGRRIARDYETTTQFGPNIFMKAQYKLDPTQEPKTIDYFLTAGQGKGKTQLGIWELKGNILKLCWSGPGQKRPTDFTASEGDGRTSTVWKLIKR